MPVVDRGERLGSITVEMPAGHPLRAREQRLLADLADQAGMAFRNARLTAELSGQVEQLGHRTRELAESRRRLITAGDAERSRLERAIARQVVPHLAPLPNRLRQLSSLDHHAATALDAALLGPLVESLNAALEALREITRGVFPAQLARSGLPTALGSLLARSQEYRAAGGRGLRRRSALRPAGRGRGVLLRGRGDARPRRTPSWWCWPRPTTSCSWS